MTRIPTTMGGPQSPPVSAVISSLAIAAGSAGHSLTLCFRDYPAPVLCEMWKRVTRALDTEQIYHVRTAKDVRDLTTQISEVRVVIVHAARLLNPVNWTLRFRRSEDARTEPAVLTASVPDNFDDDPGATLVLEADPNEVNLIENWLLHMPEGRVDRRYEGWRPIDNADPRLDSVLRRGFAFDGPGREQLRCHLVLQGLLAGACLHRAAPDDNGSPDSIAINLEDYALVRRILQSQVVSPGQELCDPLAIAMVDRANVYLEVKHDPNRNPFYMESGDSNFSRQAPRELITRREIADLGNPRSRVIRRLIDHLHTQADGYEAIRRMGFSRNPPTREQWRASVAESVVSQLLAWSPKQVRTHFDRLHKAGFVSAEREHDNGPWQYVLPEELSTAVSPFHSLPTAADLESVEIEAIAGTGTPG